jgi:hypothetical protein
MGRYERLKSAIAGSDAAKGLETSEQKLKHYEQSIFAMRECTSPAACSGVPVVVRLLCPVLPCVPSRMHTPVRDLHDPHLLCVCVCACWRVGSH